MRLMSFNLVSHALVETGNGKSELAKGIKDGKNAITTFWYRSI